MPGTLVNKLRETVFKKQNTLAEIYRGRGHLNLSEYAGKWQWGALTKDGEIFTRALGQTLGEIYGETTALEAISQFRQNPLVSTIDHIGMLNHPFFINSNLIFSLSRGLKYLIVLPTAGVSMNNSSWPGCWVRTGTSANLIRYSFFPDRLKTRVALSMPLLGQDSIGKVRGELNADPSLSPRDKAKLLSLADSCLSGLGQGSFIMQSAKASARLWDAFFPGAPKLLYCPLEKLIAEILVQISLGSAENLLYKLLFTEAGWRQLEAAFRNQQGAFSAGHKGSFLFWGVDESGRRVRMSYVGSRLVGQSPANLDMNAEALRHALAAGKVYPTSLACFLVLLYFNVTAIGGFNQVNWLTDVREKFADLLGKMGESQTSESVRQYASDNFAESSLAFLDPGSGPRSASGLDIFLTGREDWLAKYHELAKGLTVGESIDAQLPEIYKVITPADERENDLLKITSMEIMRVTGSLDRIARFLRPG